MLGYVFRRLLWTPPLLLFVMLVTFALMRGIGGSPFRLESGGLPEPLVIQVTNFYELDKPWYVEFWNYVGHVATWNFGPSLTMRDLTVDAVMNAAAGSCFELPVPASAVNCRICSCPASNSFASSCAGSLG